MIWDSSKAQYWIFSKWISFSNNIKFTFVWEDNTFSKFNQLIYINFSRIQPFFLFVLFMNFCFVALPYISVKYKVFLIILGHIFFPDVDAISLHNIRVLISGFFVTSLIILRYCLNVSILDRSDHSLLSVVFIFSYFITIYCTIIKFKFKILPILF